MSEDLYEYDSEVTDGSDAVIEPSDKETQPPLEECGQEVEWSQSPLGYFVSHGEGKHVKKCQVIYNRTTFLHPLKVGI
ncbi:hypothetical protein DPMN_096127 [Dreissena polymorpha]|uniref:Uncharacterized protein n=1 Tax=Dreissena polymorpha TaxID=45954 RepID=A0A9D4L7R6_DREPO|nr:hypothetical protein DPMN_096127 [Dreissena polymorpha]